MSGYSDGDTLGSIDGEASAASTKHAISGNGRPAEEETPQKRKKLKAVDNTSGARVSRRGGRTTPDGLDPAVVLSSSGRQEVEYVDGLVGGLAERGSEHPRGSALPYPRNHRL